VALSALVILGAADQARAQTGERDGGEPGFVLSPSVRVTDIGWDDNVFRVNKADGPVGDFTSTFSPAVQASLRTPRLGISGRGRLDFIYFRRVSQIRSIDGDSGGRVELLLGRVTPYVAGDWASTRHRRTLEIDLPIRRTDASWNAGVDVHISGKTTIGAGTRRSRVDYRGDTIYLGTDLAHFLGATAVVNGLRLRYAVTPVTTIGADIEKDRNDLEMSSERNSEGARVMSVVEFEPLSALSGRASIGIRKRSFIDRNGPSFRGLVARVDLAFTLLGRTRLGVGAQRDLSYSYRADQRDYLQTGVELSVVQRVGNVWDLGGSLGRFSLLYGLGGPGGTVNDPAEQVLYYSVDVGYNIDRTRLGVQFARQTRASDFSVSRHYEATRVASSISYAF
jgi:hypothetical protein